MTRMKELTTASVPSDQECWHYIEADNLLVEAIRIAAKGPSGTDVLWQYMSMKCLRDIAEDFAKVPKWYA